MAQERLDKLLSSTGRWSRREVKELIRQGRVWVDGVPARRPEEKCEPGAAGLTVDGELRFDILDEIVRRLPGFPIVLHGSSSVPQEFVKMINENGGKMPDAVGIPEDQLRQAARGAVCKINIDSDLRLAMTGTIRKFMAEHPDKFDPREYLKPARAAIKELVSHKIVDVLGCDHKA